MVMLPDVAEQNPYTKKKKKIPVVQPVAQPPPVATVTPPAVTPPQQAAPQLGIPVTSAIDPNYTRAVQTGTPYTPNAGTIATGTAQSRTNELLGDIQERLSQPASLTSSPYYKAAMKAAEQGGTLASRRAMEELNARGILSSTVTSDRVAQIQQQALTDILPSIMERAYGIQQDELRNMINLANLYMQQVQRQQEAETKQQQQIVENAWSRVKNLGYVDNTASIILGIPAGTLSADAKRYDDDRKSREKIAAQQNAVQWANVNKPKEYSPQETFENDIWAKLQSGQPLTPQEQQYATNKGWIGTKQSDLVAEAVKLAQNDPAFEDASEQERAEIIQRYVNMVKKLRGQSAPLPAARADTYLGVTDGMTDEEIYRVFGQ